VVSIYRVYNHFIHGLFYLSLENPVFEKTAKNP
jgi:hypothetical protein